MRDPHVRFCERHGGVILRAYSTVKEAPRQGRGCLDAVEQPARLERGLGRPAQPVAASAFGSSRSMSFWKTASNAGS